MTSTNKFLIRQPIRQANYVVIFPTWKAPIKMRYHRLYSITDSTKNGFTMKPKLTLYPVAWLHLLISTHKSTSKNRQNKIVARIPTLIGFVHSGSISLHWLMVSEDWSIIASRERHESTARVINLIIGTSFEWLE